MGASAYIGRVGGLAVALGVGVAVAMGQGVAWAETGTDSSASTSTDSAAESDSSANTAADTTTTGPAGTDAEQSAAGADLDGEDVDETPDEDETDEDPAGGQQTDEDPSGETDADEDAEGDEPAEDEAAGAPADEQTDPAEETERQAPADDLRGRGDDNLGDDNLDAAVESTPLTEPATPVTEAVTRTTDAVADGVTSLATVDVAQTVTTVLETTATQPEAFLLSTTAPLALSAPAPQQTVLQKLVTNVLSAFGFGALASKLPGAPIWSPFVMALLGLGTRRETERVPVLVSTAETASVATLVVPQAATTAVTTYPGTTRTPVYVSGNTHWIEFVTGPGNLNNTTTRFGIGGTDLGIMWDNGIADNPLTPVNEHQVLIAFGDTFSNRTPVRTGVWRFNTLFRSADGVLNNGLYVPNGVPVNHAVLPPNSAHFSGSPMENPNWSDPILPSPGDPVHPPYAIGTEVTIIPTAGVSVPYNNAYGARQYMSFMSVRSWDTPGRWTTNYSGVAYSDDNGQTWDIAPTSIRTAAVGRATVPFVSGNQNFQQGAFVKPPAGSPEAAEGWVYSYGTPSGRAGTVYLSRVQQTQIADVSKYQYWNGTSWVANQPSAAKPILPGKTTSFFGFFKQTTYPAVSEMSVQYNPYLKKYVMLYGDGSNQIVMRTSDTPQGTWSTPKVLVGQWSLPGKYAPYAHPWSGSSNLPAAEQQYLYWNLSTWDDYQVRLMRTDLTKV